MIILLRTFSHKMVNLENPHTFRFLEPKNDSLDLNGHILFEILNSTFNFRHSGPHPKPSGTEILRLSGLSSMTEHEVCFEKKLVLALLKITESLLRLWYFYILKTLQVFRIIILEVLCLFSDYQSLEKMHVKKIFPP